MILGGLPPALAILAEICNPVSERSAARQAEEDLVGMLLPQSATGENRHAAAGEIGKMVSGAAQVNSIIPTWISVTAAIAQAVAEGGPATFLPVAILVLVWAMVSMILFVWYFPNARYHPLGAERIETGPLRGLPRAHGLSRLMIACNLVVILVVLLVALRHDLPFALPRLPCG